MKMGFWQCKDGTMVEMIFDEEGNFVKFGNGVKKEDAEKATKEILEWQKEFFGKIHRNE